MAECDVAAVWAIAQSLPDAPHWPQSAYENALRPESTPRRVALVATGPESGSIVGFCVAILLPPQAEIETIAMAQASQRQGLGRQLFRAMAAALKSRGAEELFLEVRSSNRPARAFYRELGLVQTGSRPGYYTDPIEDAVLMRLALG